MKYYTKIGEVEREYGFVHDGGDLLATCADGTTYRCQQSSIGDGTVFSLIVDGRSYDCLVHFDARGQAQVQVMGDLVNVAVEDDRERAAKRVSHHKAGGKRTIVAAMPGVVVAVEVEVGDVVEDRATLVVLDAMKMQNPIGAEGAGVVTKLYVKVGDTVSAGAPLVDLVEAGDGEG